MKRGIIFFAVGITLLLLAALFFQSFSPFNLEKIQELIIQDNIQPGDEDKLNESLAGLREKGKLLEYISDNFYVGFGIALFGVFLIFNTVHLTIDKLFFKNFYEKASLFDSMRRGLLIVLGIILFIVLNLSAFEMKDILLGIVLIILLEVLFSVYVKDSLVKFLQKTYSKAKNP